MPHPENAYSFNELSLTCCDRQAGCGVVIALVDAARAWRLHESGPLVDRLKASAEFDELRRSGQFRDKVVMLVGSAVNRPNLLGQADERLLWQTDFARGITVAHKTGGFVLSWPCACASWSDDMVHATGENSGAQVPCRHVASEEHLRTNWMRGAKAAKQRAGRPQSVWRVDDAGNSAGREVPHIHFKDKSAINIDGAWKHGERALSAAERAWLTKVGWVLPDLG